MYKGVDNPNWKNGGKSFECVICKCKFTTKHYKPVKTCSQICRTKLIQSIKRDFPIQAKLALKKKQEISKKHTALKKICKCGSPKDIKAKECKICFIKRVERKKICIVCGEAFKWIASKKCCSIKCSSKRNKELGIAAGKNNANWKGGIMSVNNKERASDKYKEWRNAVFIRDNYKCQHCGTGGNLQAHHIKPFAKFKELRTDINNGLSLCKKCHNKHHRINGY